MTIPTPLFAFRRAAAALVLLLSAVGAAGAETLQLSTVDVAADQPALLQAAMPAVVESYSARQLEDTINAATSAETLKYLPSLQVRERYIGDRNGIVASRTVGTVASAQTLMYADGILLSNLLGNSFAYPPRWGLVSPEEIARVDVMYGPYSALYPGNSMGGVVNFTTRMPQKFETHANLQLFQQRFELYGTDQTNDGVHGSASVGNRIGDFAFWLGADHLDNHGQPMSFSTKKVSDGSSALGGTVVSGAYRDVSEKGQPRLVFGGYAIDHSIQDNAKLKLAYDFTPTLKATYTAGLWQLDSDTSVDSYIRDAATGATVYNGVVRFNNLRYTISGLNPGHAEAVHWMQALDLKSDTRGPWDWQLTVSDYDYRKDVNRTSVAANPVTTRTGTIQDMRGTGWTAADLRGTWRPDGHQVDVGYHVDHYRLRSTVFATSDWRNGPKGAVNSATQGDTRTQALYAQDAWQIDRQWTLTAGGRLEAWQAYNGGNRGATATTRYAGKRDTAFSPKLALGFEPVPQWSLRAAIGQAYRYPTVSELYQSVTSGSNLVQSNPALKPERILSAELTAERRFGNGLVRATLFQENKRDAIVARTVTAGSGGCVTASCNFIENVDSIRTRGVEFSTQWQDAGVHGLDLNGSLTYANAETLANAAHPEYEGNRPPRIPDWVAKAVATYRQGEALSYSLAARYSGRQYITLDNSDSNPGVYNSASRYFFLDAKASYRFKDRWTAMLGVDNLNNYKAYVLHPYPQRTAFVQLKFDY